MEIKAYTNPYTGERTFTAFIRQNLDANMTEKRADELMAKEGRLGCSFGRAGSISDIIHFGLEACGFFHNKTLLKEAKQ